MQNVGRLSPITYGKIPEGYVQVYTEQGAATPLSENEIHYIQGDTTVRPRHFRVFRRPSIFPLSFSAKMR